MTDRTERAPGRSIAGSGRFAPSPSGDLHVGNLRTAVLAWLFARSTGRRFQLRLEDLDRVQPGAAQRQLADLSAIGLDWDGDVVRQSDRPAFYQQALDRLQRRGLVYPCFCTRREIQEAASAPQESHGPDGPDGAYPGTCRNLTAAQRKERLAAGRPPALRLRAQVPRWTVHDALLGKYTGAVDDFVLRRTDGVFAYNLAVVVDDAAQAVDQVVRGADLLTSAPRQMYLAQLLGLAQVDYAHVPLARSATGARLAKRDGAVTMADLRVAGLGAPDVLSLVAVSLDLAVPGERVDPPTLLARFDPRRLPRHPWVFQPPASAVRPA